MTVAQKAGRGFTALLAASVVVGGVASASSADPGDDAHLSKAPQQKAEKGPLKGGRAHDKLGTHDRQLLNDARESGTAKVTVIIAGQTGSTAEIAKAVKTAGGFVGTVNDRIGYVRATLPTGSVDKVAAQGKVLAVDLNEVIKLDDPRPQGGSASATTAAGIVGPDESTPNDNPFMPTRDTGSITFKNAHPDWDGRGTTIGILDSGVDLDAPALQTTSTGERKIVDWVTATDPLLEGDGSWRAMLTAVSGPSFSFAGSTWTAPPGTYEINRFSDAITANDEAGGDVNRDGDKTDRWGVLYDPETHDIWVDANQDFNFSAAEKMRPYKENFDIGHFGTDNPATPIAESMPFVVEYREDVDVTPAGLPGTADFVNIGIVEAAHGTHVSGIAAGHSLFGGAMDGQAPGAKIVSSRACSWGGGCTAVALTDGMVDLVANRGVDVVNMSIGGLPALNDGNNARAVLYDSLIREYGVQLVISAGNSGPGINTIGDPSVATDVISVASSITKETWKANYGSDVSSALNLHNYSSRGPREDGGFKPNVMAPGSAISSIPTWQPGGPVAEAGYTLPPGYAMFNGTSMASPQTAGGAALLLSAAKQSNITPTARQLRESIYSSANFTAGVEAIGQGNGQVNIPGAWELLQASPATRNYTTDAPVCTPISDFLATPGRGPGIYNRCAVGAGGQSVGEKRTYEATVTRTSGPAGDLTHKLVWLGNDGTFSSASAMDLPLNTPVRIKVKSQFASAGAHSAVLLVDDPKTPLVDHRMLVTVVGSGALAAPSFSQTLSGTVERNLTKKLFVTVPAGAKALQVNLSEVAANSQVRFIGNNPYGVPVESTSSLQCFSNFSDPSVCNPTSRNYANPMPGIWEFEVEARRTSPLLSNPFTLTAAAQGVTVDPATQTLASVQAGVPSDLAWTVTNTFGAVTVGARGGSLGSALSERKTIADQELQEFGVDVPAGAERLTVTIGRPSDLGADLDLYLLNPAGVRVAQSADGDSEESVSLANPAAGHYTVQIDGYSVPAGTTEYDYLDVFLSSALGSISVPGTTVDLARGDSAPFTGQITANSAPAAGRQLFGAVNFVSSAGAVLGTGSVLVGSVTP